MSASARLLLVEDEVNMVRTLAKILERRGYAVDAAVLELLPFLPHAVPKTVYQYLEDCLLDPKSFSESKNLFWKKLNTIKKLFRAGKLDVTNLAAKTAKKTAKNVSDPFASSASSAPFAMRIFQIKRERQSMVAALEMHGENQQAAQSFRQAIKKCDESLKQLKGGELL